MFFLLETLRLGLKNLLLHKLRSFLTALGIIFGVSAVIMMVSIGEGNKQQALREIDALGASNIIVRSDKPPDSGSAGESSMRVLAYGLQRLDQQRIEETVNGVERIVPLKRVSADAKFGSRQVTVAAFGTTPDLQQVASLRIGRGRFLADHDLHRRDNVAVIGATIAQRLFPLLDPLDHQILLGSQIFDIVGVMEPVGLAGGAGTALVGRDLNLDVYIPITTAYSQFGDVFVRRSSGSMEREEVQLHEMYIQAASTQEDQVLAVADQVKLVIDKEHKAKQDVSIIVPLEILNNRKRALLMFNALMIAIAAISLVVGGIGIMNIMLASVTERTREIGIRRALGATRNHIISQFLVETTILSSMGGLIGVLVGVSFSAVIALLHTRIPGIEPPVVTLWSIVISFTVASSVGIIFGLYPAVKAARQDPIVALRHD